MAGILATVAEFIFALALIVGFHTTLFAKLSGALLRVFAISVALWTGIKRPLEASVFVAATAAFALPLMSRKVLEWDGWIARPRAAAKPAAQFGGRQ